MKRRVLILAISLVMAAASIFAVGCDDEKSQTPEHVHTYSNVWTSDDTHHWNSATCEHTDETFGKAEHVWSVSADTASATCTEDGVKTYACLVCSKTKTENVDAIGHDLTAVSATAATCTSTGNTAYYTCDNCGKWFADADGADEIEDKTSVIIAVDGSAHTSAEFDYVSNGDGTHEKRNACCNAVVDENEACAYGDDEVCDACEYDGTHVHEWSTHEVTRPATCTEMGQTTYSCACGEDKVETDIPVNAAAHVGNIVYAQVGNDKHKQEYSGCRHEAAAAIECSANFNDCTAARECECGRTLSAVAATHNLVLDADGSVANASTHHAVKCSNGTCEYVGTAEHTYNSGEFTCSVNGCGSYDLDAAKTASYAQIYSAVRAAYEGLSDEGKRALDAAMLAAYDAIDAIAPGISAATELTAAVQSVTDTISDVNAEFVVTFITEDDEIIDTKTVKYGTRVADIDMSEVESLAPDASQTTVKEYKLKKDRIDGTEMITADTEITAYYEKVYKYTLTNFTIDDSAWYNISNKQIRGFVTTADGIVAGHSTAYSLSVTVKINAENTTETDAGIGFSFYQDSTRVVDILSMNKKVRFLNESGRAQNGGIQPGAFDKAKSASGYTFTLTRYGNEMTFSDSVNGTLFTINNVEGVVGWTEQNNDGTPSAFITDALNSIFTKECKVGIYFTFADTSKTLDATITDLTYTAAPALAATRTVRSNITLPAAMISEVKTAADMNGIMTDSPSIAILNVNADGNVVNAQGGVICTLESAIKALDYKIIPAVKMSGATAARGAELIKANYLNDVMFVSDIAADISAVRATNPIIHGVLDLRTADLSSKTLGDVRAEAITCGAKIIILPADMATPHNTDALNTMGVTVWYEARENTKTEMFNLVTSGANGIVTADRKLLENTLGSRVFKTNSIIRPVSTIGHRGTPSLAPELTIAGSSLAATKGANIIETDLYITTDGVVVISHDNSVATITNGTGNVEDNTYEWYRDLLITDQPDLSPLPSDAITENQPTSTLDQLFTCFKGTDTHLFLEIKSKQYERIAQAIKTLIDTHDIADQCSFVSFNVPALDAVRQYIPEVPATFLSARSDNVNHIVQSLATLSSNYSVNGYYTIDEHVVDSLAVRGITTWPWTINTQAQFDDYVLLGVGGTTTDSSFFAQNYVKFLLTDKKTYSLSVGGQTAVTVSAEKFSAAAGDATFTNIVTAVQTAEMVVIDGNETVAYANGKFTATAPGSATVLFRYAYQLNSGQTVYVYSTPVEVNVQ